MKIHTGGCLDIFATKIQDNVGVVGGVGIGIGLLQVTFFCCRKISPFSNLDYQLCLAYWNDLCLLFGQYNQERI